MRQFILFGLLLCAAVVQAQPTASGEALTLRQALARVLQHNPTLQGSALQAQAMAARTRAAQQTPPMRVQIDLENFAGSGSYSGSDALDTTLSLAKIFELGDKSTHRADVAQQAAYVFASERDAQRLDILADAARQFIHVVLDQSRLELAAEKRTLLERSLAVIERRVQAGRSHAAERRRMQIAVARAGIELEHAQHELQASRVRLAALWGETQAAFSRAQAELFAMPEIEPFTQLRQRLEQNPDLVRLASEQRLAQARVQLAQSRRRADIELSAGVRNFGRTDDNALVFSASIPFGLDTRARPHIEAQEFAAQRVPLDLQQRRLELYGTLYGVYQEIVHSHEASRVFREQIIPQAQQALNEYEQGYAAGRFSFLELSDAQHTLLQAQFDAINAAANYHTFRIEIDRLTGAGLSTGEQP